MSAQAEMILWGLHSAHGPVPLKLSTYSVRAFKRRKREGWALEVCEPGERPVYLHSIAQGGARMKRIESVTVHIVPDDCPDTSWLGSYSVAPRGPHSIERVNARSNKYRWFNPVEENLKGETEESARLIAQADFERMEGLNDGTWCFIGIYTEAKVISANGVCRRLRSGGLYGIESDCGKAYQNEVREEQLHELRAELVSFGFTEEQIDEAFLNVGVRG